VNAAFAKGSIAGAVREHFDRTRTALLVRHFLFESQSRYVKSFLMGGGGTEFLRARPDAEWRGDLMHFDSLAAGMQRQAVAAGVPFVAVLVPNRAQAAMISMGEWPRGDDPYTVGDQLRDIVTSHGGTYIDILPYFRNIPNPERYYFPVDGHPDANGQALIANLLAKELTGGAVPALKAAPQPQISSTQRR